MSKSIQSTFLVSHIKIERREKNKPQIIWLQIVSSSIRKLFIYNIHVYPHVICPSYFYLDFLFSALDALFLSDVYAYVFVCLYIFRFLFCRFEFKWTRQPKFDTQNYNLLYIFFFGGIFATLLKFEW